MNKFILKKALTKATGCKLQHTGWPCGKCFFAINKKLTEKDWQAVLSVRGDYNKDCLDNLPKDIDKSLAKVVRLCKLTGRSRLIDKENT